MTIIRMNGNVALGREGEKFIVTVKGEEVASVFSYNAAVIAYQDAKFSQPRPLNI